MNMSAACIALDALDRRMVQVTPLGIQGEGCRLGEKTHRVLDRRPGADSPRRQAALPASGRRYVTVLQGEGSLRRRPPFVHRMFGTGIPASILVLNRDKPARRKGKVLFIDASGEFEEGSNQNRLRDQDIDHLAGTFHAYADVEKYARVVPLAEIEQNDWNLNISRYVDTSEEEERIDVAEAVRKLRERELERAAAVATMNRYLAELGYGVE